VAELLELAQRIASWGQPGEEVEAFVAWQRETEVRAYGGEVESLSSAESAGIGIRVVAGASGLRLRRQSRRGPRPGRARRGA